MKPAARLVVVRRRTVLPTAAIGPARQRRGFTLIELLSVIAIIGILAAIIIPVVGKVRTQARTATGLSNLRQLGLASLAWAEDNRGYLPASWESDATEANYCLRLSQYLFGNTDPGKNSFTAYPLFADPLADGPSWVQPHYGANPNLLPDLERTGRLFRLEQVRRPSETILLFDTAIAGGVSYFTGRGIPRFNEPLGADADALIPPGDSRTPGHFRWDMQDGQAAKVVFADGHTALLRQTELRYRNIQIER